MRSDNFKTLMRMIYGHIYINAYIDKSKTIFHFVYGALKMLLLSFYYGISLRSLNLFLIGLCAFSARCLAFFKGKTIKLLDVSIPPFYGVKNIRGADLEKKEKSGDA